MSLVRLQAPRQWTPVVFSRSFFCLCRSPKSIAETRGFSGSVVTHLHYKWKLYDSLQGVGDSLQIFLGGVSLTERDVFN